jgi:hypothetical protein
MSALGCRHAAAEAGCPLLRKKRTSAGRHSTSAFDRLCCKSRFGEGFKNSEDCWRVVGVMI